MSSSTLISERRWASSRKGMTVLGKVPKPINLPSQKLENHGLDPNVEIVPKGTLTWGSRSLVAPNAWSSSPHSSPAPSAEGSIGSPSHHNSRPSSGGGGTRPSTADSDRCSEPATNVWASGSRPSSSSGILTSNQAPLAATRPRSAETRPCSSLLSRFAESIPENSVSWGNAGAPGCLGPTSKASNFTLSSGDFPTLGSTKDSETHDQQASRGSHGHLPTSGSATTEKGIFNKSGEVPSAKPEDNSNAWKVTNTPYLSVSPVAISGSWNAEHQSNQLPQGTNMPSHHYGRHDPPPSTSDGVWYGDVPPSGPYGPGVGPPGSYLPDRFAYYPSQIAARPSANTSCSPIPGALLSGYPHKKGELVRPQMASESYMVPTVPVIPIRPGIYSGPMPYDGYYGPPRAGFFNSSEKERTIIGMAGGSGVYNQFQNQNVVRDPGAFGACSGSSVVAPNDQSEGLHSHDSHGEKFRVLLKHRDGHDGIGARNCKGQLSAMSLQLPSNKEMDTWDEDSDPGGKIADSTKTAQGSLCSSSPGVAFTDHIQLASLKDLHLSKDEAAGDIQLNKGDAVMPPSDVQHVTKKSALIEKIEGLNNKARIDGRSEVLISSREEKTKNIKTENARPDSSTMGTQSPSAGVSKASSADARSILNDDLENSRKKTSDHVGDVKAASQQSATTVVFSPDDADTHAHMQSAAHIRSHASHGRSDQRLRSRINDGDGRKIHIPGRDSLCTVVVSKAENGSDARLQDGFVVNDNANKQGLPYVDKAREEASTLDSADYSAQRAKMKEIVAERAKQLQREEEERNREQKAKALAKLEELNRRALVDGSVQKVDRASLQSKILRERDLCVVPVKKTDAQINVSTGHAPGSLPKVDKNVCTEGGKPLQDMYSGKHAEPVVHTHISGKRSEDSIVTQKVNFSVTAQISFGTVQPCDVGINKGEGMAVTTTCSSSTEKTKEVKNSSDTGPHTFQPGTRKSVSQKPSSKGEAGNRKLDASIPDKFSKQRYNEKRRNTVPQDKNVMEVPGSNSDVANSRTSGDAPIKSAFNGDDLVQDLIEANDPLLQHKKKSNRSNRARVRLDHNVFISTSEPQVPGKGILENPPEACKIDAAPSQIIVDKMEFQGSMEEIVPDSIGLPQSAEEGHTKMTGQWKPHPPRRATRNTQARSDKFRVSESVMWAPVRSSPNKGDLGDGDQVSKNQDPYSTSRTDSQINLKFKRAEMERYTTKFVAKDTSQSEDIQTSLSVSAPTEAASNEIEGNMSNSSVEDALLPTSSYEVAAEIASQDSSRTHKHVKGHASWRQRSSHDGSLDALKAVANPSYDKLMRKTGISPSRDASHFSDGWTDTNNTVSLPPNEPLIVADKDHGGASRSKRQLHKMYKPVEAYSVEMDAKFSRSGISDKPKVYNSPIGSDASDGKSLLRIEKPGQVERTRSHWKPKVNQSSISHIQQQVNSSGDASQSSIAVKELSVQDRCLLNMNDVDSEHLRQQGKYLDKVGNTQKYEAIKERIPMTASAEDCSDFSCEDPSIMVDHDNGKDDPRSVHSTRGMHRQGQHRAQFRKGHELAYGARYSRGQEANYGGRSSVDDYLNLPGSVDRPRHSSHYEYLRVEPPSKSVDQAQRNAQTGDNIEYGNQRASGSRYREWGHFDYKYGGHFYTQSGGTCAHGGQVQQE